MNKKEKEEKIKRLKEQIKANGEEIEGLKDELIKINNPI